VCISYCGAASAKAVREDGDHECGNERSLFETLREELRRVDAYQSLISAVLLHFTQTCSLGLRYSLLF
jgi:hypothetical protein